MNVNGTSLLKSYQLYMLNIVMNSLGTEDEVNHTRNNGPLGALTRDYDKGPLDALTCDYFVVIINEVCVQSCGSIYVTHIQYKKEN